MPTEEENRPRADYASFDYAGFEDRFRGAEADIQKRQRVYLTHLEGVEGPILDLGCGRGEFLALAGEAGFRVHGVDLSPQHVERCKRKGLAAELADGFERLAATQPGTLGALVSLQTVEHFPFEDILRLVHLAAEKLRPGGRLILETPNPYNKNARMHFWLDPTHVRPVHPELLQFLAQSAGFRASEIHYLGDASAWADFARRDERAHRRADRSLRARWARRRASRDRKEPRSTLDLEPGRLLDPGEGSAFPDYYLLATR